MCGAGQRPYLTTNNELVGTGGFVAPPPETTRYRLGYLCGVIRGDGHLKEYWYKHAGSPAFRMQGFRLALADQEALERTYLYLSAFQIPLREGCFYAGSATHRPINVLRTGARAGFDRIRQIIRYPLDPCDDWRKGFLAGIFDAEGSCTAGTSALRIPNTDPGIIMWTRASLQHFGFDAVVEDYQSSNGLRCVRLRGGLREQLRFFHLTDPAITRKRDIEGLALKSDADLRVTSIEPLAGAMRLYDITTGTGDFIANGVVSHNCFARPTHEYLGFDAGRDFEREIVVKVNAPEVLRAELKRPSWRREHVALGTNTDPYQWVEKRYRLTRGVLEALRDARNPCSVLTKSPLLLRDLALFQELVELVGFSACLSIPTLDERAWRATEPHTPHPRKRLEAVAALNAAGVPTGVLVAPLMPGINDAPEQVEAVVSACDAAGATRVGGQALFLRGSTRDVFMGWLRSQRPDLVERYERLYAGRARLARADRAQVEGPLARHVAARKVPALAERFQRGSADAAMHAGAQPVPSAVADRRHEPVQESLF